MCTAPKTFFLRHSDLYIPVLLFSVLVAASFHFVVDDTYITFLVSKNLIDHGKFSTSAAKFISPTTAYLHAFIGALFYLIGGLDFTEWGVKSLGLVMGVLSVVLVHRSLLKIGANFWVRLVAGVFIAGSFPLVLWTASAMETIFVAALLLYFSVAILDLARHPQVSVYPYLLATCCFLMRVDSVIVASMLLFAAMFLQGFTVRSLSYLLFVFLLPISLFFLVHKLYFGAYLPTPALKASFSASRIWDNITGFGVHYFRDFLLLNLNWIGVLSAVFTLLYCFPAALKRRTDERAVFFFIAVGTLGYVGYIMSQGYVHMMFTFRFYAPLVPLFGLMLGYSLKVLLESVLVPRRLALSLVRSLALVLLLVDVRTYITGYGDNMYFSTFRDSGFGPAMNDNIRGWSLLHQEMKEAGRFFAQIIPANKTVGLWVAGILPFYIGHEAFDNALIGSPDDKRVDYIIAQCTSQERPLADIVRFPIIPPSEKTLFHPWTSFCLYNLGSGGVQDVQDSDMENVRRSESAFQNVYDYALSWELQGVSTNEQKISWLRAKLLAPEQLSRYAGFLDDLFHGLSRDQFKMVPLFAYPGFNVVPHKVRANIAGLKEVQGHKVLLVHAPSVTLMKVPQGAKTVQFRYGILPSAYEGGGDMKAIALKVEAQDGNDRTQLLSRILDPLSVSGDRGVHESNLQLNGAKLVRISYKAGPSGNCNYAATWISDVIFK